MGSKRKINKNLQPYSKVYFGQLNKNAPFETPIIMDDKVETRSTARALSGSKWTLIQLGFLSTSTGS